MLYIHIPYCHHKCTYCGFYSVAGKRDRDRYIDALCKELETRLIGEPLRTIYIGGGTPTLLTLPQMGRLVEAVRSNYNLTQLEEVTLEANPEDVTPEYLEGLNRLGFFNRLSIGIQSFSDSELKAINRVHSARQAKEAILNAARAGMGNVSIDLIMGLPGQTLDDWSHNLDEVERIADATGVVKHLSCYELTVESGSILERQITMGRVHPADEDTLSAQYGALAAWADRHGFEQYEVSNFCQPGYHSRHNSRYWDRTPYLGVGASAHSFDGTRRRWNVADVEKYTDATMQGETPFEEETLSEYDAYNEYVMTALRTSKGIDSEKIAEPLRNHLRHRVEPYVRHGLITVDGALYRPTREGMLHADGIAADLFIV